MIEINNFLTILQCVCVFVALQPAWGLARARACVWCVSVLCVLHLPAALHIVCLVCCCTKTNYILGLTIACVCVCVVLVRAVTAAPYYHRRSVLDYSSLNVGLPRSPENCSLSFLVGGIKTQKISLSGTCSTLTKVTWFSGRFLLLSSSVELDFATYTPNKVDTEFLRRER